MGLCLVCAVAYFTPEAKADAGAVVKFSEAQMVVVKAALNQAYDRGRTAGMTAMESACNLGELRKAHL